jgi:hypothetical protein
LHDRQDGFVTGFSSFGEGLAGPGDLDGDGIPDLVVSDSHDSDGGEYRGAVWLVSMRADGSMKDAKKISNWEDSFEGILHNGSNFGSSVCGPGDIDGDGVPDLLVGSQEGLWTLFLKRDGTVRTHSLVGNPAPDRQRASEFPICMTSTSAHDAGHPVRLMLGEVILGEKWRSETLRWAVLDSTWSLRAP